MEIVLASRNRKKAAEMQQLLNDLCEREIRVLSLDDIGFEGDILEDGLTFEDNAAIKASVPAALGYLGIADDSGLSVDHLDGAPGVFSARYAGDPCDDHRNNEKLMAEMKDVPENERGAAYVSVIAFAAPGEKAFFKGAENISSYASSHCGRAVEVVEFRGECRGKLLDYYQGTGGFGYDPMFYVKEFDKTFAETTADEKNSISHRGKSMRAFAAWLNSLEN